MYRNNPWSAEWRKTTFNNSSNSLFVCQMLWCYQQIPYIYIYIFFFLRSSVYNSVKWCGITTNSISVQNKTARYVITLKDPRNLSKSTHHTAWLLFEVLLQILSHLWGKVMEWSCFTITIIVVDCWVMISHMEANVAGGRQLQSKIKLKFAGKSALKLVRSQGLKVICWKLTKI